MYEMETFMFQLSYIRAQLQTMHTHAQLNTEIHTDTQTQSKMHTYMITKIRSEEPAFFSDYLSVEETLLFLFLLLTYIWHFFGSWIVGHGTKVLYFKYITNVHFKVANGLISPFSILISISLMEMIESAGKSRQLHNGVNYPSYIIFV